MLKLKAKNALLVEDFLKNKNLAFEACDRHEGPVNIVFPQIMKENIGNLKKVLDIMNLNYRIHLAHKPTKSKSLIRAAFETGIGIDVASPNELNSASEAGFTGDNIECTGAKTRKFLKAAVENQCLISIDSVMELKMLMEFTKENTRILLRVADPECRDRNYIGVESRFGIPKKQFSTAYDMIKTTKLKLCGFHYHNHVRIPEVKAGFVDDMISIMQEAYSRGLRPEIINIGGDFRQPALEDYSDWEQFLDHIEQGLIQNKELETWRNYSYGMYLNARNRVSGREKVQGMFTTSTSREAMIAILMNNSLRGRPLSEIIAENMWTLMLEPGWLLLQDCGITLVKVIGVKETESGKKLIIVNANRTNFSTSIKELFADPLLISKSEKNMQFSGYIVGNLCEEQDFITKRLIHFDRVPEEGDLLCFLNTAAYVSDFEEASPIQQPISKKFSAVKVDNWSVIEE